MHFNNPQRIRVFLKDRDKKGVLLIIKEVLMLLFVKKEVPMYYFKHLYKKEITNVFDYLGTAEAARIQRDKGLHKYEHTSIMNNKLNFALYCQNFSLPTPTLLGHNLLKSYFLNGELRTIENKDQLVQYFENLLDASGEDDLFVKPLADYGGKGCLKLSKKKLSRQIDSNMESLLANGHIFSKVVQQHPEIDKIHSKSLNTLRIITYITDENTTEVVSTFMRFGIGESIVDNGSSGGLYVGIGTQKGQLKDYGYKTMTFGGDKVTHHPNSNFRFGGFKIPYFKEACELAVSAVDYFPDRWIGWDIAITPDGPIIIEANDCPDLHMSDVASEGLLKNRHIKNLVEKLRIS